MNPILTHSTTLQVNTWDLVFTYLFRWTLKASTWNLKASTTITNHFRYATGTGTQRIATPNICSVEAISMDIFKPAKQQRERFGWSPACKRDSLY